MFVHFPTFDIWVNKESEKGKLVNSFPFLTKQNIFLVNIPLNLCSSKSN